MAQKSTIITAICVIALTTIFVWIYLQAVFGVPQTADPMDLNQVARGSVVYSENCAECHGKNLQGQPNWRVRNDDGTLPAPPHDETGHTWHHPDQLLFDITQKGGQASAPPGFKSAMPPFEEVLSDGDIWAALSFIKSHWPDLVRKRQTRMNKVRN